MELQIKEFLRSMKYLIISLALLLTLSCANEEKTTSNQEVAFYPEKDALFRVKDEMGSNIYYFFPNDSIILKYKLREWQYQSSEGKMKKGADFHANDIYIKKENGYLALSYLKHIPNTKIQIFKKESSYRIQLIDGKSKHKFNFNLVKAENFKELPKDPRNSWMNYYKRFHTDTLIRFVHHNDFYQLISISQGIEIDTVKLVPPSEDNHNPTIIESDTFLVEKGSSRYFVFPKLYAIDQKEIISEKESFKAFSFDDDRSTSYQ